MQCGIICYKRKQVSNAQVDTPQLVEVLAGEEDGPRDGADGHDGDGGRVEVVELHVPQDHAA